MTTQHQQLIYNEIVDLQIRKACIEGFNPSEADLLQAVINQLKSKLNETKETQRGEGFRHTGNRIREIKIGC